MREDFGSLLVVPDEPSPLSCHDSHGCRIRITKPFKDGQNRLAEGLVQEAP
jgi:hypothetical protein